MSVKIASAVLERGPGEEGPRITLFLIAFQADDLGFYAEDVESIRKSLGCTKETVLRRLAALEKAGWLRIERRVLDGRSSVYFINLEKLGVSVGNAPYKHKLWRDIERLRNALDSGDKLSRLNGVLKFEKTPDSAGTVITGDLFGDENSGDNLSPENCPEIAAAKPERPGLDDLERENAQKDGVEGESGAKGGPEPENSGDNLSPVRCEIPYLSGDNFADPFNTSRKSRSVVETNTPLSPQGGEGLVLPGLVLPFEDPRPGDDGWALCVGLAARWVMQQAGVTTRTEGPVARALELRLKTNRGETLIEAAELARMRWEMYLGDYRAGLMWRDVPVKFQTFFAEGCWLDQGLWGYDKKKRQALSEATAGTRREQASAEVEAARDAARRKRAAAWVTQNAELLRANAVPLDDIAERVLAVAGELEAGATEAAADAELRRVEGHLFRALAERLPAAKVKFDEITARFASRPESDRGAQDAKHQTLCVQLSNLCDTPYLSLRFMPDV